MTEKTQPTDAELLPCPFCGGLVNLEETTSYYDEMYGNRQWWGVVCRNTTNRGGSCAIQQRPSASKEAAVERWNRRTPQPTQAQAGAVPLTQYRVLEPRVDRIEAGDEFLQDDAQTWATDPNGTFVGAIYGYALRAARRRIKGADHG